METIEKLTIQEVEQLCRAYLDCNLTRLQEKELELVLLCSDLTSPIIVETRALMGLTTLMSVSTSEANYLRKAKQNVFRFSSIAACVAIIIFCTGYFINISRHAEMVSHVYACVDGIELTGFAAQTVANDTENETMNMFRSIIEDVECEQRRSEQLMHSITE